MSYIKNIIKSEDKGIWKIIMNNGLEYSWNFENGTKIEWLSHFKDGLFIKNNWFSKKNCSINDFNEQLIYNIEIIHNYEKRAMINIMTVKGDEYRKEVNLWNERNSKCWTVDNHILI
jgi:hypothetical protein